MAKVRSSLGQVVDFELLKLKQDLTPIVIQNKVNIQINDVLPDITEEPIAPKVSFGDPVSIPSNITKSVQPEVKPEPKKEPEVKPEETKTDAVELQVVQPTNEPRRPK